MADEYQSSGICSSTGNWWNSGISSSNSRNGLSSSSSPCSTTTHISSDNNIGSGGGGSYGWCSNNNDHHQMMDMIKTKSNCDQQSSSSVSISGSSSIVYQSSDHTQRPPEQAGSDSIGGGGGGGHHLDAAAAGSVLMDSNLQMMGFDLSSSPTSDWTQTLLGRTNSGRAAETNFQSMLQESHDHGQVHHHNEEDSSSIHAYKQMNNQVFNSLDPQCFNSNKSSAADCIVTCQGLPMNFSMNSSATTYECPPSSTLLHGLYDPVIDQQSSHDENQMNYCMNSNDLSSSWSSKFPQFLKSTTLPTKEQPSTNNQLQFSNNAQFWNASSSAMMTDIRSSLFSSPRSHFLPPTLDDQKPNCSNISLKSNRDEVKKTSTEPAFKRPRIETPLPTFKVRKEKLGDRITALQQLCSPFGKTDTASVLFEAIEYIKFLHDQVSALSNPYMKTGAPQQYQQNLDKSKDGEGHRKDLRSRGLCLVPISSTFTVTNEASTDFWTPTFGGTYR